MIPTTYLSAGVGRTGPFPMSPRCLQPDMARCRSDIVTAGATVEGRKPPHGSAETSAGHWTAACAGAGEKWTHIGTAQELKGDAFSPGQYVNVTNALN